VSEPSADGAGGIEGGTFRMTRAAVPAMRARNFGRITYVTSYTGLHGNLGQANYATAKRGSWPGSSPSP
jgi:NAD(P)-dependent dehydrogenase (short-subunit alcohol dehydrogenase family)